MSTENLPDAKDSQKFFAVCHDCGTMKDESFDNTACGCGGVFHVDSAICSNCGKRHHFHKTGASCDCGEEGEIVPKVVRCPSCKEIAHIDHLGEFCPGCNVLLVMEG